MARSILIVDDERLLVRTLSAALRDAGLRTVTAASAELAERYLDPDAAISVAVLDNRLPGRSGLDILREARARGLGWRVVLMTAHDSAEVQQAAQDYGVDRYVQKPFDLPDMVSTIAALHGAGEMA